MTKYHFKNKCKDIEAVLYTGINKTDIEEFIGSQVAEYTEEQQGETINWTINKISLNNIIKHGNTWLYARDWLCRDTDGNIFILAGCDLVNIYDKKE